MLYLKRNKKTSKSNYLKKLHLLLGNSGKKTFESNKHLFTLLEFLQIPHREPEVHVAAPEEM